MCVYNIIIDITLVRELPAERRNGPGLGQPAGFRAGSPLTCYIKNICIRINIHIKDTFRRHIKLAFRLVTGGFHYLKNTTL